MDELRVLDFLGGGSEGQVYYGKQRGKTVAIKKVSDINFTCHDHLLKLNHQNIVKFFGIVRSPPACYIIMEFCQHGNLYNYLRTNLLPAPKIIELIKQIVNGVEYLHSTLR